MLNSEIACEINPIAHQSLDSLFIHLRNIHHTTKRLSIKYNDIAHYCTIGERLNKIRIKGMQFYMFIETKKYHKHIKNILECFARTENQGKQKRLL